MGSRCTGHCCRHFSLRHSPEDLWAAYRRWQAGGHSPLVMSSCLPLRPEVGLYVDIHLVAPMVVYLGHIPRPYKVVNPEEGPPPKEHYYTCKHFDTKAENCTIYSDRPAMCKDYPYGHVCQYASCTWTKRKEKKRSLVKQKKAAAKLREIEARLQAVSKWQAKG